MVRANYKEGGALAEPGGLWRPTFAPWRLENLRFFIQIICWALDLDFTGSEHWAPFNFPSSTALLSISFREVSV